MNLFHILRFRCQESNLKNSTNRSNIDKKNNWKPRAEAYIITTLKCEFFNQAVLAWSHSKVHVLNGVSLWKNFAISSRVDGTFHRSNWKFRETFKFQSNLPLLRRFSSSITKIKMTILKVHQLIIFTRQKGQTLLPQMVPNQQHLPPQRSHHSLWTQRISRRHFSTLQISN